jgi:hypothetical protein
MRSPTAFQNSFLSGLATLAVVLGAIVYRLFVALARGQTAVRGGKPESRGMMRLIHTV